MDIETRTIEARTHGRYLIRKPAGTGPWPLLVGFHGYRENAAMHLAALEAVDGADAWLLVAVQGLHRFYTRGGDVVASWMTKEDRDLAIADNVAYVRQVIDAVRAEYSTTETLVFAGFSQGTAMAFRAAAHVPATALIVVGADVPPDVAAGTTVPLPPILYGRGDRDELYAARLHADDVAALERMGVVVESVTFDGGHELSADFLRFMGRMMSRFSRRSYTA
jgi:predicted esterase